VELKKQFWIVKDVNLPFVHAAGCSEHQVSSLCACATLILLYFAHLCRLVITCEACNRQLCSQCAKPSVDFRLCSQGSLSMLSQRPINSTLTTFCVPGAQAFQLVVSTLFTVCHAQQIDSCPANHVRSICALIVFHAKELLVSRSR
jgi:hypothetical protein